MLTAGLGNGMERSDRTSHAKHATADQHPDRRGPPAHHLVYRHVRMDPRRSNHGRLLLQGGHSPPRSALRRCAGAKSNLLAPPCGREALGSVLQLFFVGWSTSFRSSCFPSEASKGSDRHNRSLRSCLVNMNTAYEQACAVILTGNPDKDWRDVRRVLEEGSCAPLKEIAQEVRNLRILERGTSFVRSCPRIGVTMAAIAMLWSSRGRPSFRSTFRRTRSPRRASS